jgi:hypothetical protein
MNHFPSAGDSTVDDFVSCENLDGRKDMRIFRDPAYA